MKEKLLLTLGLLALGAAQAQINVKVPSQATRPQLYGLVGVGGAHVGFDCPGQARCDSSGFAHRAVVGLRHGENWIFELGVLSFLNFDHKIASDDSHLDIEGRAFVLAAGQQAELTPQWVLSYRAGLASVRSKSGMYSLGGSSRSATRSEASPYAGLSLAYRFNKVLSLQIAGDFLQIPVRYANGSGETANTSAFTLGLGFNF